MTRTTLLSSTVIASALLALTSIPAFAQTPTPSPKPYQIRNQAIRDAQQEFRDSREKAVDSLRETKDVKTFEATMGAARTERKEEITQARQTYRSERAKFHGERLQRRFDFYAQRLTNIATRIQSRIDKEKTDGKDVTKAQSALDTGKTTLTQAVADGKKAVEMFQSITVAVWDTQKPEVKAAIDQAQKARKGFVSARQSFMDAVKALATN